MTVAANLWSPRPPGPGQHAKIDVATCNQTCGLPGSGPLGGGSGSSSGGGQWQLAMDQQQLWWDTGSSSRVSVLLREKTFNQPLGGSSGLWSSSVHGVCLEKRIFMYNIEDYSS